LPTFADFATCPAEPSGLHEVAFTYDDEQDYIARALELEYQVLRGGTSVFANPVVVSILVKAEGAARGIRIVTDDRVSARDRVNAVTMARNFKARYGQWNLSCTDVPPREGEQPAGNQMAWLPPSRDGIDCAKVMAFKAMQRRGQRDEGYDDWG